MVSLDHNDPIDVIDRQLWRDAQDMLLRHVPSDTDQRCGDCGRAWPCASRRAGERAELAAFRPWNEAWTVRNDLRSLRADAAWQDRNMLAVRSLDHNRGTFG